MKKVVSLVLGVLVIFAMSTSFAADKDSTTNRVAGPCWRQSTDGGNGNYCGGRGQGCRGQGRGQQGCPYYQENTKTK